MSAKRSTKRPRTFQRDACISFRVPSEDKSRIWNVARQKRRDPSSLLLEWSAEGLKKMERELQGSAN